jgi:hypothetical protein
MESFVVQDSEEAKFAMQCSLTKNSSQPQKLFNVSCLDLSVGIRKGKPPSGSGIHSIHM